MERKKTPLKAIRLYCFFCMNDQATLIRECDDKECFFFHYRMGKNESNPRVSALKQIRKYCYACADNSSKRINECPHKNCSLWIYRFGKNPARAGIGSKNPVFARKI